MGEDDFAASQVATVCVVLEGDYLFGVFTTEKIARKAYGTEDEHHPVTFNVVPLWEGKPCA